MTKTPAEIADGLTEAQSKGPVQILCEEIGFPFDRRMERADILVAFVAELVAVVRHSRETTQIIAKVTGVPPSEDSGAVLTLCEAMLGAGSPPAIIKAASAVHEACSRLNPEEAYPTDHLIDMLSSCASALRFGLEKPCQSRHAADAADHVWSQTYGVSLFDKYTPEWSNSWARSKLQEAILGLAVRDELRSRDDG